MTLTAGPSSSLHRHERSESRNAVGHITTPKLTRLKKIKK